MPRNDQPPGERDRARLEHMLEAARHGVLFVAGRDQSELATDHMLRRSLINAIQEIGEAAARTSETGRARVPGVPWGQIVEMRNILVHVYWGVDLDRVWKTALEDLPPLIGSLESAIASWPAEPPTGKE